MPPVPVWSPSWTSWCSPHTGMFSAEHTCSLGESSPLLYHTGFPPFNCLPLVRYALLETNTKHSFSTDMRSILYRASSIFQLTVSVIVLYTARLLGIVDFPHYSNGIIKKVCMHSQSRSNPLEAWFRSCHCRFSSSAIFCLVSEEHRRSGMLGIDFYLFTSTIDVSR